MPPKANRGSRKKQTKGRKRGNEEEAASDSQPSAQLTPAISDEGEEQKQSSSDAHTPLSKKTKLESAAAAAVPADSEEAAADTCAPSSTAAVSSSAPTPCARLDLDSLSVVFSFLNMRDFLSAIRASRHWRAARVKKSAWPAFNLDSMIALLREDDFDNPQRRKLDVTTKAGDRGKLNALLKRPGVMDMWRHVTEIKLAHTRSDDPVEATELHASIALMQLIPQFASLVALTLDGFGLAPGKDGPASELFDALSSRLLMLGLFRCSLAFGTHLHRLSSLRVLVLGWIPEADSLLPLRQLVYLHIEREASNLDTPHSPLRVGARLGYTIRWLSVHHQLRSFSVEGVRGGWHLGQRSCSHNFLQALLSCNEPTAIDAAELADLNVVLNAPLDPTVPCALSDVSVNQLAPACASLLGSLPSLTRLQSRVEDPEASHAFARLFAARLDACLEIALPRLQQLRMEGDWPQPYWHHLVHCTALRTVHLTQHCPWWHASLSPPRALLRSLLQAWSPTLEECKLDLELDFTGDNKWREIAACHRLRLLELRLGKGQSLPDGVVAALQGLPSFQSLAVSFDGPAVCPLPPNMLSVMVRSRFFSTLHLHALSASRPPDFLQSKQPTETHGLSSMLCRLPSALLTSAVLGRIRVFGHRGTIRLASAYCFRIGKSAEQMHVWARHN